MALRLDTDLVTARAADIETVFSGATLSIYTGTQPATADTAASGTLLAQMTLPADPFTQSSGVLTKNGTWQDSSANASGTAGYFRITSGSYAIDGSITATSGGGDMELDDTSIVTGGTVTVSTFTWTEPQS